MKVLQIINGIRLFVIYIRSKNIVKHKYSFDYASSRHFKGGRYGDFTARGWKWVIDDYKNCKRMGVNLDALYPVSSRINVVCPQNITFHPDDLNNFQTFGCYFQAYANITIGKGTWIGPNVGIITANHEIGDLKKHAAAKPVMIGEKCWIGMNSVILPGIELGANTIVGAGSVVTKSFPEGNCVIAGNPCKKIKTLK